jgi:hypothetical protein
MYKSYIASFAYLVVLAVLALPFVQYHVSAIGYLGVGGLFVNDTLGMESNLLRFAKGDDINYLGIIGVLLLYYPSYYLGNIFNLIINLVMLFVAANYFIKTLLHFRICVNKNIILLLNIAVIFNFYLYEILLYPNKEIPLIALTNAFLYYSLAKKNKLLIISSILAALLVRDGHGLILAATYFIILLFQSIIYKTPIKILLFIYLLLSFVSIKILAELNILGDYNYILNRNIDLVNNSESVLSGSILNTLPNYLSFPIKVFNHFAGSALRPQYFDINNRLYLHGVGLWQNGLIIFIGMIGCFKVLLNPLKYNRNFILIAFVILLALLMVSAGSYTQARYLFPYIFWLLFFSLYIFRIDVLVISTLMIIIISALLIYTGYGSQVPTGIDIAPIPYIY